MVWAGDRGAVPYQTNPTHNCCGICISRSEVVTVRCGQQSQHLKGHIEAIHNWRVLQFVHCNIMPLFRDASRGYTPPQFVVATERPFTTGGCYSLLSPLAAVTGTLGVYVLQHYTIVHRYLSGCALTQFVVASSHNT